MYQHHSKRKTDGHKDQDKLWMQCARTDDREQTAGNRSSGDEAENNDPQQSLGVLALPEGSHQFERTRAGVRCDRHRCCSSLSMVFLSWCCHICGNGQQLNVMWFQMVKEVGRLFQNYVGYNLSMLRSYGATSWYLFEVRCDVLVAPSQLLELPKYMHLKERPAVGLC